MSTSLNRRLSMLYKESVNVGNVPKVPIRLLSHKLKIYQYTNRRPLWSLSFHKLFVFFLRT
jgi:hypothetical protein